MKLPSKAKSKNYSYNDWLDYFKLIKADELLASEDELKKLPVEAYAAARRWIDIIENPTRMDKILQGRLDVKNQNDIMETAIGDDDEAFYSRLIQQNVAQLCASNTSPQEVARLSQNINIFRRELREIRSHRPSKDTTLGKVFDIIEKSKINNKKIPSKTPAKAVVSKKMSSKSSGKKNR